ncbi:DUF4158 domain-containing protein [Micromonospora olivasterospora]|uniref:DUF4158 domain-containing protein n=1 Tax=Micromonospora olivasterospora TaxID=1880 RepID=UPI0014781702
MDAPQRPGAPDPGFATSGQSSTSAAEIARAVVWSPRAGFALLLKFYTRAGRFPRGRGELPDEAVEFVARQVGVDPAELRFYEWSGSTIAGSRYGPGEATLSRKLGDTPLSPFAGNVGTAGRGGQRRPENVSNKLECPTTPTQVSWTGLPLGGGRQSRQTRRSRI